ncbi:hypothetical protein DY000_02023197 [Brassica cretica]|uniref:Uncharacterized protein n=1 Tax=Brassica cretica TaxID=69181 RepID=A0ABQ7E3U8_BRACR|nr:hypothetical protein DY000_02023197 [Brassica cretica]
MSTEPEATNLNSHPKAMPRLLDSRNKITGVAFIRSTSEVMRSRRKQVENTTKTPNMKPQTCKEKKCCTTTHDN